MQNSEKNTEKTKHSVHLLSKSDFSSHEKSGGKNKSNLGATPFHVYKGFQRRERESNRLLNEVLTLTHIIGETESLMRQKNKLIKWVWSIAQAFIKDISPSQANSASFPMVKKKEFLSSEVYEKLKEKGLFDKKAYLTAYPDVMNAGIDPLCHYIEHGMHEGRTLGILEYGTQEGQTSEVEARIDFMSQLGQYGTGFIHRYKTFSAFVILPVLLSIFYYGFIASDQYVSEASFVVKSQARESGQISTFANLIQTAGLSRGQEETYAVIDYLRSRDALADLQKRVDARAMFMNAKADIFSRYPFPFFSDCFDNLYDYYKDKVEIYAHVESGITALRIKAFNPEDAQTIAAALLSLSEEFVNRMNARAYHQAIIEAERHVSKAEDRVKTALSAITDYRNMKSILDPGKQASSILEVITKLSTDRANIQARLDRLIAAAPNNPSIKALREHSDAVTQEIEQQKQLMTGDDSAIASKLGDYSPLLLQENFASKMLETANVSLESARAEANKQQFYLQRVVEPNTPDLARYPKRLSAILIVFGSALCLYLIGWMLFTGILEHKLED